MKLRPRTEFLHAEREKAQIMEQHVFLIENNHPDVLYKDDIRPIL